MDEAYANGDGAIRFRGEVVDEAHVLTAREGLARVAAFAAGVRHV
jgi:hypothetical protein